MRTSRSIGMLATTVVLALVVACPGLALAAQSGVIYGQATQIPVIAITVSGTGASETLPLTYDGESGETAIASGLGIANESECGVDLFIMAMTPPSDGLGDSWDWGTSAGPGTCVWSFANDTGSDLAMPASPVLIDATEATLGFLAPGDTAYLTTGLTFPSDFANDSPHRFQAIVTATEAEPL